MFVRRSYYGNVFEGRKLSAYDDIIDMLDSINAATGIKFVIIIDEWDTFFRDEKSNKDVQIRYINLLRRLSHEECKYLKVQQRECTFMCNHTCVLHCQEKIYGCKVNAIRCKTSGGRLFCTDRSGTEKRICRPCIHN